MPELIRRQTARAADLAGLGLMAGLLALLAATGSAYELRVLTVAGLYALAVLGYQIIFGHAGALSLAQGTFFGLGAYASAILALRWGLPFELSLPAAILLPAGLALLVGLPVVRLESHYIALATLGIGQVVLLLALHGQSLTGGANGLPGVPPIILFGYAVEDETALLALVWTVVALAALPVAALGRGRSGLAFAQLRDDPAVAASLGLNGGARRLGAFVLSAAYGGAAGALAVHTQGVVSPEGLGFPLMVSFLTMAVVGGRGRASGAILGALLLVHLPEWLRGLDQAYRLAYGVLLLLAIVAAPDGLIGRLEALARRMRHGLSPVPTGASAPTAVPAPLPAGTGQTGEPGTVILTVEALEKAYGGVRALAGVSLTVRAGEIVALLGPNGSGKTTLLNLISGATPLGLISGGTPFGLISGGTPFGLISGGTPFGLISGGTPFGLISGGTPRGAGTIRLNGQRLERLPAHRRARLGIARTFQAARLPLGLSAGAAVAVAGVAPRAPRADGTAGTDQSDAAAEAWGLVVGDLATETPCADLPPALMRRVELARALARDPVLLLVDEPVAGLGPEDRAWVRRGLVGAAASGRAVLMVEHDLAFVRSVAHRVVVLVAGRVVYDGPAGGLETDDTVRRLYLGLDGTGS